MSVATATQSSTNVETQIRANPRERRQAAGPRDASAKEGELRRPRKRPIQQAPGWRQEMVPGNRERRLSLLA
ncbi:hypothetical protein MRX96_022418 [Rhipicephalus microplus]